ncbi:MAG: RNA polymerase subunit sigma [Phycisphaerae bacterium]|nr:RNA polymerase subunit sigma [Phycisphaerae bacterium]
MQDLTAILRAAASGDGEASSQLLPLVYDELRSLAAAKMGKEPAGHTLQPTALVHEAFLRLCRNGQQNWENRAHFFCAAAEAMRRILVERARRCHQRKRGGGRVRVPLNENWCAPNKVGAQLDTLDVDEALSKLERFDGRLADIVKLRCFAAMNIAQTAESLGLSARTVSREWRLAKAWLAKELEAGPGAAPRS